MELVGRIFEALGDEKPIERRERSVTVKAMLSFSALVLCCVLVCSLCISEILVNRIFSVYLHGKPLTLEQGRLKGVAYFLHV